MLHLQSITFAYLGEEDLFRNLSFAVTSGEFVSLIGRSGCGKSSVFRIINGFEKLQYGQVLWEGVPISEQQGVAAYMPQRDLLLPWRTIIDNLCLPLEIQHFSREEALTKAEKILQDLQLSHLAWKRPAELSGGMRQRISFARALLQGAPLLLLDEPFSALDALTRRELCTWLKEIQKRYQRTILFITHSVEEAIFLSDRIMVFNQKPLSSLLEFSQPFEVEKILGSLDLVVEAGRFTTDVDIPSAVDMKEEVGF